MIFNIAALVVFNKYIPSSEWPAVLSVGPFIYWVIFYYMGVLLSDNKRVYNLTAPISLLVVGIISMAAYLALYHKGVGINISSWIYSAGMILLLFSRKLENVFEKETLCYRGLVKIGRMSFGIYLIHVYIVLIWQHILPIENWLISFVTVSILSVIAVTFMRKLIPLKYWKLLGLN